MHILFLTAFVLSGLTLANVEAGPGKPLDKLKAAAEKTLDDSVAEFKVND